MERDMQYLTSVWLVYIPLQKSLSLTHFLALSLSRLLFRPWAICLAHQMWLLTPPLPQPLASQQHLLSGCPQLLGLLFILATIAPSHDYANKPAISDWCPLGFCFFIFGGKVSEKNEVNVSNLRSPQGECQSNIFNLETSCTGRTEAITHPAGVNLTEAIWVSSKRCITALDSFVLY